jgi:hypothetical protein
VGCPLWWSGMTRPPSMWAILRNDLRDWARRPASLATLAVALAVVVLTPAGTVGHGTSLYRIVLGGPQVGLVGGRLVEGPEWTWFLINILFAVATLGFIDTSSAWVSLSLVRGVSRTKWAAARLVALALGGLIFLGLLVAAIGVSVVTGWRPGPLITRATAWDVWLWTLGVCVGNAELR